MKSFLRRIPAPVRFLFIVYGYGLFFFTVSRLILFATRLEEAEEIPALTLLHSLWMGFRFDSVISGYFLALPMIVFFIFSLLKKNPPSLHRTVVLFLAAVYSCGFFIAAADIPYFNQFNSRLTIMALAWADHPAFVGKMIFSEVRYIIYLLLFIFQAVLFYLLVKKAAAVPRQETVLPLTGRISVYLLSSAIIFLAIRGRVAFKSPIRWGTAYFSSYALANQAGLNPVYTFTQSWLDSLNPKNRKVQFMEDETALSQVQKFLTIRPSSALPSPLAREVRADGEEKKYNVILVIMESMSAKKMGLYGNPDRLTPNLDSIAKNSFRFNNIYSAGIHTFNGVYSILYGMPGILHRHPMKGVESQQPFSGIAKILSAKNYSTSFFMTHDEQFDNIAGFLTANGFSEIFSEEDFPPEKTLSTLGVPDHVLFSEAIPRLNKLYRQKKPFFAAFLTASDHGPYVIPDDISFTPHSSGIKKQIVEYADWSIGQFISQCRQHPWADSTIFIFTADHGASLNPVYDMDLSYHHIPFIVHAPGIIQPGQSETVGGQIDIFPTLLSLLNTSYINNTLGIDLFNGRRPFIFFCKDEDTGCLNEEYFIVLRKNGIASLYRYKSGDTNNYLDHHKSLADSMKAYAWSMLQAAQWMIENRKVN